MPDDQKGAIRDESDGGVSGEHDSPDPFQFLVAPTTSDQFNRAHLRLIPVACWRVDDIRFAFDSAFVDADYSTDPADTPDDIRAELQHLVALLQDHPDCPLSVFGHADPVGTDDYNKLLSGRRAMAIYALLIFNTDPGTAVKLWQYVAGQEKWGSNQQDTMRAFTGLSVGAQDSELMKAYMQKLCPPELKLSKKDFLAQGADSGGKADFQGCSEFNPVLLFSQEKQARFDQAAKGDRSQPDIQATLDERNADNAPNRRVMVLLFRKGSRVDPNKWPCPRAKEGIASCKLRFWGDGADGDTRRSTRLPNDDRTFQSTEDTFACRFYQRITDQSPCHKYQPVKPCDQKSFPPRKVSRPVKEVISNAPAGALSWNGTYEWVAKFTVVVTRAPCAIKVIVKLKVTGAITNDQKSAWKSAIESKWNDRITLYCPDAGCAKACPDGYPVSVSIEYVTSGQHQTVIASPETIDMAIWGTNDTVDVTHEFGHMLGNPEEYYTTNGTNYATTVDGAYYPARSPNGSVMNNPANDPEPRHYDLIRQEAGKAMKIDCSFENSNGVGDFPQPGGDVAPV